LIIIAVATAFGLFAVFLANSWFSGVQQRQENAVAQPQSMARIAVASLDLPFGTPLTSDNVRLVAWPGDSVPPGAYHEEDAQRLLASGNVAIRPIAAGEPILLSRVSERAVLSANIPPDMRAVTVPIDPVSGVAGFVTPGDVVDVMLTRKIQGDGASSDDQMVTTVLENVQVLAVDTRVGEQNTETAADSKTATLQVFPEGAQKLALASQIGRLSLALRNVEDQSPATGQRVVTTRDRSLSGGLYMPERRQASSPASAPALAAAPAASATTPAAPRRPTGPAMTVIRGTETTLEEISRHAS
jgi:pilus assembly protein CpaB